jgi:hypothetical protein
MRQRGLCLCQRQQYLIAIKEALSPAMLERSGMRLVVVGCGSWEPIADYRRDIDLPYPVYGDPTRAIHRRLRFVSTLEMSKGPKPSYLRMSQAAQIWGSFKKAVSNLSRTFQVGSYSQNGGEMVLGPGPRCAPADQSTKCVMSADSPSLWKGASTSTGWPTPRTTRRWPICSGRLASRPRARLLPPPPLHKPARLKNPPSLTSSWARFSPIREYGTHRLRL